MTLTPNNIEALLKDTKRLLEELHQEHLTRDQEYKDLEFISMLYMYYSFKGHI